MSNVVYQFEDNFIKGILPNQLEFLFDFKDYQKVKNKKWYVSYQGNRPYIVDRYGTKLHSYIFNISSGLVVDHISLDTLDNRRCNLRICTKHQNQMNHKIQSNNTSGVTGVSYYIPRKKYRARIKIYQKDLHLGYYDTFEDAVKARNVGMQCMFGSYGRYNSVSDIPEWIKLKVINRCAKYSNLSKNSAFFDFWEGDTND
ncbi:TPA: HNH endonuclease [Streptococcus suis]|nr:HNH endonuclease [Streptococcus suis]